MNWLFVAGLGLVMLGVALFVVAAFSTFFVERPAHVTGGAVGCVVVLFVPICFGVGESSAVAWGLTALAVVLAAFLVFQWLLWKSQKEQQG